MRNSFTLYFFLNQRFYFFWNISSHEGSNNGSSLLSPEFLPWHLLDIAQVISYWTLLEG